MGMCSKFPHSSFQSPFLVFYEDGYTQRSGFFFYLIVVVAVLLLLALCVFGIMGMFIWKKREDEKEKRWTGYGEQGIFGNLEDTEDQLYFDNTYNSSFGIDFSPATEGDSSEGRNSYGNNTNENDYVTTNDDNGTATGPAFKSISSAGSIKIKEGKGKWNFASLNKNFNISTSFNEFKKKVIPNSLSKVTNIYFFGSIVTTGSLAVMLLLLYLIMMKTNADYSPILKELELKPEVLAVSLKFII